MKKLMTLTAVVLAMGVSPALADHHEDGHDGAKKHHKERMFEKADKDGDGVITKAEFMAAQEEMFAKLDADGDGSFTKAEAEAMKAKWKEKMKEMRAEKEAVSEGEPSPKTAE